MLSKSHVCLSGARVRTYLSWTEILFELLLLPIFAVLQCELEALGGWRILGI
jgi:hypothetical protein